ncbi:uncharacterized protein LOC126733547 [Anthonomus grandis grandis]|uniref:uncharacterized protein LOC126733547 n=1 Tax=Anthonomus grandis grandis TaxID=2921223 RepID=UPI002165EB86|nr:uncharacterized protein LOC126733547 [Anthonomus grandis grandis]
MRTFYAVMSSRTANIFAALENCKFLDISEDVPNTSDTRDAFSSDLDTSCLVGSPESLVHTVDIDTDLENKNASPLPKKLVHLTEYPAVRKRTTVLSNPIMVIYSLSLKEPPSHSH